MSDYTREAFERDRFATAGPVQPPATPQEPAVSAPGADPLAAIRQRLAKAVTDHEWSQSMGGSLGSTPNQTYRADVSSLLAAWDTRESALRALVAQWREKVGAHRRAAHAYTRFYDEGSAQLAQAHRTLADCIEAQADAVERLLSGPQP